MKRLPWVAWVLAGCIADPGADAGVCGSGTDVDGRYCVWAGGIQETGFACPPERSHRYERRDGAWAPGMGEGAPDALICSSEEAERPEDLDRALGRAGGRLDGGPARDALPIGPDAMLRDQSVEPDRDAAVPDAADAIPDAEAAPPECAEPRPPEGAQVVQPFDVIMLSPTGQFADVASWEWVITARPNGSVSQPVERFFDAAQPANGGPEDATDTPTAFFFVDVAGLYRIELRLRDARGEPLPADCPVEVVNLMALPTAGIFLDLRWDTPGDPDQSDGEGADVDLHLRHPLGQAWDVAPYDCAYNNAGPDWGAPGPDGDPSLLLDDTNGAGPELLTLERPEATPEGRGYRVGVHYYRSDNFNEEGTWGPSDATLRIYLDGALAFEETHRLEQGDEWWVPAEILFENEQLRIVEPSPEPVLVECTEERFDTDGNRALIRRFTYADGRLIRETDDTGEVAYRYDAAGRVAAEFHTPPFGETISREYTYDAEGRRLTEHRFDAEGTLVEARRHTYAAGRRTLTETSADDVAWENAERWSYDAGGRLIEHQRWEAGAWATDWGAEWGEDSRVMYLVSDGNRTGRVTYVVRNRLLETEARDLDADAVDEAILQYAYDAAGGVAEVFETVDGALAGGRTFSCPMPYCRPHLDPYEQSPLVCP